MSDQIDYELCDSNEIENNSMKSVEIKLGDKTFKVLLIKYENKLSCMANACSHYGVPLSMGVMYKGHVRCMAHGACFNVNTGDIEEYPGVDCLPTYKVHVNETTNKIHIKTSLNELEMKRRQRVEINPNRLASELNAKLVSTDRSIRVGSATVTRPKTSVARPGSGSHHLTTMNIQPATAKSHNIKYLIIGSGAAGMVAMDTLREHGISGVNLTVLTKDTFNPYDRPKLSKGFDFDPKSIILRDDNYFSETNINLHRNQEVEKIDFNEKKVTCKSGRHFNYDKLIISAGMQSADVLQTIGRNLKGIFTLRSMQDATSILDYYNKLKASINSDKKLNIVLVGGSFIAMEAVGFFVENLPQANHIVISRNKPFESIFGSQAADKIVQLHQSKGVQFITLNNFDIHQFHESQTIPGKLGSIQITDHRSDINQSADLCILAIGGQPCTEFLANSSELKMTPNKLIIVDKNMKTNLDDVYAVGDITSFPAECIKGIHVTNDTHVNIQHWSVACNQGRSAALALINQSRVENKLNSDFITVPFFWSMQLKKSIRFAGFNKNYDSVVFHDDAQNALKFAAFYLNKEQIVVGVASLDWDPICAIFTECLYNGIEVKREHIEKDPNDLKKLLTY
jgi:apoptosis-inducing factor 3